MPPVLAHAALLAELARLVPGADGDQLFQVVDVSVGVGGLSAGGLRLAHRLLQCGHQVQDLAFLLGLGRLGQQLVLPLGLDDLRDGFGVGVAELLALQVLAGHGLRQRQRALDLALRHLHHRQPQAPPGTAEAAGREAARDRTTSRAADCHATGDGPVTVPCGRAGGSATEVAVAVVVAPGLLVGGAAVVIDS